MSHFDPAFIEEVKDRTDLVGLIEEYLPLRQSGDNFKGLCPFHQEKTPSFMVSQSKQIYKCFGCGEGGNAFTFLMKKENMEFPEALRRLCERAGLPWPEQPQSAQQKAEAKKRAVLLEIHVDCARYYYKKLAADTDQSLTYLKARGLNDKAIKNFGLGYAPGGFELEKMLLAKGYKKTDLLESGLFKERSGKLYARFFNRVMFPIFDLGARVIAFGGRVITDAQPKYLNSADTALFHKKDHLYALQIARAHASKGVLLTEGYMDVIRLHQAGFKSAVASLGTAFTQEQAQLIKRVSNQVYVVYDSDPAGRTAALRAIEILEKVQLEVYTVDLQGYKDPDELIAQMGSKGFEQALREACTALHYKVRVLSQQYDKNSPAGLDAYLQKAAELLKNHKNPIQKEQEVAWLSQQTGVSLKAIGSAVYGAYFSPRQFSSYQQEQAGAKESAGLDPVSLARHFEKRQKDVEQTVLKRMVSDPKCFEEGLRALQATDFYIAEHQQWFKQMGSLGSFEAFRIEPENTGTNTVEKSTDLLSFHRLSNNMALQALSAWRLRKLQEQSQADPETAERLGHEIMQINQRIQHIRNRS